jgi:sec-independent protein translocase protein TatA
MALGPWQILIVLLLIVLVFGASRVPSIAENLAKGIQSFKKGLKDDDEPKSVADQSKSEKSE